MERLLVIKLDALGCEAEALLNGLPVARVDPLRPRAIVPVHEYTLAGANQLELVVWPYPAQAPVQAPGQLPKVAEPRLSDGLRSAHLRVLLPRIGSPADEGTARTLGQLDWAPAEGETYNAPLTLSQEVTLPVSFPRWRWLDAPVVEPTPTQHALVLAFLQAVEKDLAAGEPDRFLNAARLRTEEIATAYQRQPAEETQRWREHLLKLHAAKSLVFKPLAAESLVLRPIAGGRLLECVSSDGGPALATEPDAQGRRFALPLRVTAVEGKVYVLR